MNQRPQYRACHEKEKPFVAAKYCEKSLENLHDLAVIAERRNEKTISHEKFKRNLKRNGLTR